MTIRLSHTPISSGPVRPGLLLAPAILLSLAYCTAIGMVLGIDLSVVENGPQESLEAILVAGAAASFLAAALVSRAPGGSAFLMLALICGLGFLREVEPGPGFLLADWITGHEIRVQWVVVMLAVIALHAWRQRGLHVPAEVNATRPSWLGLGLAFVIGAGGSALESLSQGYTGFTHDLLVFGEETAEMCAYAALLVVAIWNLARRWSARNPLCL